MCDRILVLCEGRLTAELTRAEATQERIMEAATARQRRGGLTTEPWTMEQAASRAANRAPGADRDASWIWCCASRASSG